MKTTILKKLESIKEIKPPLLVRNIEDPDFIILLSSYSQNYSRFGGTILSAGSKNDYVGHKREDWTTDRFIPFKGQLILEND